MSEIVRPMACIKENSFRTNITESQSTQLISICSLVNKELQGIHKYTHTVLIAVTICPLGT